MFVEFIPHQELKVRMIQALLNWLISTFLSYLSLQATQFNGSEILQIPLDDSIMALSVLYLKN